MTRCPICKQPAELRVKLRLFCSIDHAAQWGLAQAEKVKAKKQAEQRRADRVKKESLKTRSEWLKDLQVVFNKFIRLRDKGLPCISCNHPDDGSRQRHASHYKSVGGNPALRFDESNCHSACSICNNWMSGNLVPYRAALIDKIGLEKVEWLEGKHEPLKLTIDEIKAKIAEYRLKIKEMT